MKTLLITVIIAIVVAVTPQTIAFETELVRRTPVGSGLASGIARRLRSHLEVTTGFSERRQHENLPQNDQTSSGWAVPPTREWLQLPGFGLAHTTTDVPSSNAQISTDIALAPGYTVGGYVRNAEKAAKAEAENGHVPESFQPAAAPTAEVQPGHSCPNCSTDCMLPFSCMCGRCIFNHTYVTIDDPSIHPPSQLPAAAPGVFTVHGNLILQSLTEPSLSAPESHLTAPSQHSSPPKACPVCRFACVRGKTCVCGVCTDIYPTPASPAQRPQPPASPPKTPASQPSLSPRPPTFAVEGCPVCKFACAQGKSCICGVCRDASPKESSPPSHLQKSQPPVQSPEQSVPTRDNSPLAVFKEGCPVCRFLCVQGKECVCGVCTDVISSAAGPTVPPPTSRKLRLPPPPFTPSNGFD